MPPPKARNEVRPLHRFFVDDQGFIDGHGWLSQEEAAHALRVLRLRPGDAVELSDGRQRYAALLEEPVEGRLGARLLEALPDNEPGLRITLYQGLPKGEKMDFIVQKATEIGAAAIVPVCLSRCVARPDGKAAQRQQVRWQRIAREAAKQCGRATIPQVSAPLDWRDFLAQAAQMPILLVPWEEAAGDGSNIVGALGGVFDGDAGILIGPEGGIAPGEMESLVGLGAVTVDLGPRILRTDTAAIAALTLALLG